MGCTSSREITRNERTVKRCLENLSAITAKAEPGSADDKKTLDSIRTEIRAMLDAAKGADLKHMHDEVDTAIDRVCHDFPAAAIRLKYLMEAVILSIDPDSTGKFIRTTYDFIVPVPKSETKQRNASWATVNVAGSPSDASKSSLEYRQKSRPKRNLRATHPMIVVETAVPVEPRPVIEPRLKSLFCSIDENSGKEYGFFDIESENS